MKRLVVCTDSTWTSRDRAGNPLHTFETIASCTLERRRRHRPPGYSPAYDPANLRLITG